MRYRIEKVSSNEEKKIITDVVSKSSVDDISKSSYTQAYQENKAGGEEGKLNIKLRPYQ